MRPRSYARKPTDAHMSSRTHPRTPTYIHPCTHTYARIRARGGNFLTTNLLYSITKPSSVISPTPFTSIIQSLYNPYQYWHHIGCAICTNCQHLTLICYTFTIHYHPFATITQLSANNSIISHSYLINFPLLISLHHLARIIFHLYLMSIPTHHPINMSVCYKTLSILYIFTALPYTTVSHLQVFIIFHLPI